MSYRNGSTPVTTNATLIRVGADQAHQLGTPPFTFFASPIPDGAVSIAFRGRDADDAVLWTSAFSH